MKIDVDKVYNSFLKCIFTLDELKKIFNNKSNNVNVEELIVSIIKENFNEIDNQKTHGPPQRHTPCLGRRDSASSTG